jgi:hypothetical protein
VRRPDGREVVEEVPFEGDFPTRQLPRLHLPGDPIGPYEVEASQGAVAASGTFTVRRAAMPRVTAVEPYVPPAPRETVRFHVYRAPFEGSRGRKHTYLVSMTARVDRNGETLHQIHTDRRAPEAKYLVRVKKDVHYPFHLAEPPAPGG